jgi:hypothetical protein
MNVYFGSGIPTFILHVTVLYIKHSGPHTLSKCTLDNLRGAEKNIWTEEVWSDRKLERTA